ncbi:hypothetical protein C884_02389 [Kocuria palustris PEL]|uniref:Uncharacterized protein n=1 Tax=Kocuria palustris PEL TaxID=1236550 RepID=M2WE30_9MICC|nr:hypothetical protein C884_02389 [Kocuria palustris PEL]
MLLHFCARAPLVRACGARSAVGRRVRRVGGSSLAHRVERPREPGIALRPPPATGRPRTVAGGSGLREDGA